MGWEKDYQDWLKDFSIKDFLKQKSKEEFLESEYVSDLPLDKDATYGDYLRELKKTKKYETEDYPGKGFDWFGDIKKIREKKKKEAMEGLVEGAEQRGFIGEDYDRYDRPREDIELDLFLTKPKIKPKPEEKLSMWQKIGKHFSENADKRDQLFSMIGSMGRELVKPIEPGEEAAGALVPTLSKGMKVGAEKYAAQQTADAETALKYAEARQKMNPMQYMSNAMTDAIGYVEGLDIDPRTPKGKAMIAKYLLTVGVNDTVVALNTALGDAREELQNYELQGGTDKNKIKAYEQDIQNLRNKLNNVLLGDLGGSGVTETFTDKDVIKADIKDVENVRVM
jgi:hypothetical protein